MNVNDLLCLLSARRGGSWQQFRAAVSQLQYEADAVSPGQSDPDDAGTSLPLYQLLRLNLDRLGHVEFFAQGCEQGWRAAPPVLAVTCTPEGLRGVVAGARSLGLLERIRHAAGRGIREQPMPGCPDRIEIIEADAPLDAIALAAGIHLQLDAPVAILAATPSLEHLAGTAPAALPEGEGWAIDRFDQRAGRWEPADRTTSGLLRFSARGRREHYFVRRDAAVRVHPQIGKFLAARHGRRRVLTYDAAAMELRVPHAFRPPPLIERALVLVTGAPPIPAAGELRYREIPLEIARLTANLLHQELA